MEITALEALAFSMHQNRGAYALLLGSGLSRAAGIPTAYEIAVDLARRFAPLRHAQEELSPEQWWQREFGALPSYEEMLERLGRRPEERSAIIRSYIEPTEEERARGLKVPQPAHQCIALLVRAGYVKMIVTTNFDPLIEAAVEAEGVIPDVITSDDDVSGARHFAHSPCTVLKVNGDYRDVRIRNTAAELQDYGPEMTRYLDSVLDAFGLVTCGWSADYDVALREALRRAAHRRYTAYWAAREGKLREEARRLAEDTAAEVIPIRDADTFFGDLWQRVLALRPAPPPPAPNPLAAAAEATRAGDSDLSARLHEMVMKTEADTTTAVISGPDFPLVLPEGADLGAAWRGRVARYETATRELLSVLAAVVYCDRGTYRHLTVLAIERLAEAPPANGLDLLLRLRLYPALRALYVVGITAVHRGHLLHLRAAFDATTWVEGKRQNVFTRVIADDVLPKDIFDTLGPRGYEGHYTPRSDYLFDSLRELRRAVAPSDSAYRDTFDTFEYLAALVYLDLNPDSQRAPPGAFTWRTESRPALAALDEQVAREGPSSPLLAAGLFGGDPTRYTSAAARLRAFMASLDWA